MTSDRSSFRVRYSGQIVGSAKLTGNTVRFRPDASAAALFERQPFPWLKDFQRVVRRVVRSTGHVSKFSSTEDIDTGIIVERLS